MTDEQLAAELRHALNGARVGYDAAAADTMIANATVMPLRAERTAWAAPVAAAAAVVVVGAAPCRRVRRPRPPPPPQPPARHRRQPEP